MPRVNVYLPDQMVAEVRPLGLNLSQVLQAALRERLNSGRLEAWLHQLDRPTKALVGREAVRQALDRIEVDEHAD